MRKIRCKIVKDELSEVVTIKEVRPKEIYGIKGNKLKPYGTIFDGLTSITGQLMFGSIQGNDIVMWIKTEREEKGYILSKVEDDITYLSIDFWLRENTSSSDCFISCISPNYIFESLKEHLSLAHEKNYQILDNLLDSIDAEEGNPIIFEYHLK